ncbi:MAG TPA: tRNA (N(6)-L-threonylcarbamoyladenosine(37)-C(2))-methylthiotransferase [Thermoplasmata archaeon]|nr:tRNA (N(6)-L-threonylcarbamoyladenosine(37)-C(2))-methylthiotransferase [Thermoplasmata archaeon]
MRVFVESFGCSQNQGEGAAIARDLASRGHALVREPLGADVGVLVTCGVIGPTESRMVRRWEVLSSQLPRMVVTGCLVPLRCDLMNGPGRSRTTFVPIREQSHLPALLDSWGPDVTVPLPEIPSGPSITAPPVVEEVVIAQGCTSGCTYCFSRLARGRLSSVPADKILERVRDAVGRGVREVRLTGLDTAAWGEDLPGPIRLPELLRSVTETPGDFRVRVGMMSPQSLEPHLDRYLDSLAHGTAYRFLHLPLQSGSDRILDAMHRGYRVDQFRRQVEAARRRIPDLHLATDVIVGFPGETEEDFRATEELLEWTGAETVNVTRFSARPGTPASRMTGLPPRVAKRRSRAMAELRHRVSRARLERWIGARTTGRVLEHGPGESSVARLSNYLPVVLDRRWPLGTAVEIRVDGARSTYLLGTAV